MVATSVRRSPTSDHVGDGAETRRIDAPTEVAELEVFRREIEIELEDGSLEIQSSHPWLRFEHQVDMGRRTCE